MNPPFFARPGRAHSSGAGFPACALLICGILASCGHPLPDRYVVVLPPSPPLRREILGEPRWRLEWYDPAGKRCFAELSGGGRAEISLPQTWPCPVLAWPYWPDKGLPPGLFRPAGAVFPLDAAGDVLTLKWRTGAEAAFYRELAEAQTAPGANPGRHPRYFDWKRFRALLGGDAVPEAVRADPWRADWKTAAAKTVQSGFRTSYIKAEARTPAAVVLPHGGPWLEASPFSETLPPFNESAPWTAGDTLTAALPSRAEVWICPGGTLTVSPQGQVWKPWR